MIRPYLVISSLWLMTACGASSSSSPTPEPIPVPTPTPPLINPDQDQISSDKPLPVADSSLSFLAAQRKVVPVSSSADPKLVIANREKCTALLNFMKSFEPAWNIKNLYPKLGPNQTTWRVESNLPELFFSAYPTELEEVAFTVQFGAETSALSCFIPKKWKTLVYRDAAVKYPSVLQNYSVNDPIGSGTIQEGAKGGIAFVKAPMLGYQPRISWALFPVEQTQQDVQTAVKQRHDFLADENLSVEFKDLIDRQSPAPGEVYSFSLGSSYNFDKLFVKPAVATTQPIENQIMSPYFDSTYYDFSLTDPVASLNKNSKSGFETKIMIDVRTLKPIDCVKNGSASDPNSCQFRNKLEIYKYFSPLFETASSGQACVMTFYKLNADVNLGGLVKVICIDGQGRQVQTYNKFNKYVTDAIAELNGRSIASDL